jgi:hypothetical protein
LPACHWKFHCATKGHTIWCIKRRRDMLAHPNTASKMEG